MNLSFETVASVAKPIAAITLGIVFSALLLKKIKPYFQKRKTKVKGSSKRKASGVIFGKFVLRNRKKDIFLSMAPAAQVKLLRC